MNKKQAYIKASRHFLIEELPENWQDLTDEEITNFLNEHKCEFMHDYDANETDYIWECIEALAFDFEMCQG